MAGINHLRVPRRTRIMGDMMNALIMHGWIGCFNHAVMALATLASFDNHQTDHHSTAFFIASSFELQAHVHLQCLARNQPNHMSGIK